MKAGNIHIFKSLWSGLCAPWVVSIPRGSQYVIHGCADTWEIALAEALRIAPILAADPWAAV